MSSNNLQDSPRFTFQLHGDLHLWSPQRKANLIDELRACAALCLDPLPEYQCLSRSPTSLDDKIITIARYDAPTGPIAAFTSAVRFSIPSPVTSEPPLEILHTGLTCIAPEARSSGLSVVLHAHTFRYMVDQHPSGFWFTSIAEVPSSLVNLARYGIQVYPAPFEPSPPSNLHLHIARFLSNSRELRDAMMISPEAVFDEDHFVFKGSNAPGSCFRKDSDDARWHHRDRAYTDFYRRLLGHNEGNEVLQVGRMTAERVAVTIGQENRLRSVKAPTKTRL
ncbi:hypothetical protein BXZ70DRAFT_142295 [Cristinia sonorae]|uniref:Uncharacterized protein n=1 Tax=Cristinia sonorae TaxID=1940300 RepID=A0A8K0XQD8_9AGAR|nr:hypothetical protein BXZ70DRAFT_142295 [Cristinia sonorae]